MLLFPLTFFFKIFCCSSFFLSQQLHEFNPYFFIRFICFLCLMSMFSTSRLSVMCLALLTSFVSLQHVINVTSPDPTNSCVNSTLFHFLTLSIFRKSSMLSFVASTCSIACFIMNLFLVLN